MTRPPLTLALSSVLAAQVEGAGRPALLATLYPEFGRTTTTPDGDQDAELAQIIPMPRVMPISRVIPISRQSPDDHPDPSSPSAA